MVTPLVMNVTLSSNSGQAPVLRRAWTTIFHVVAAGFCGLLLAAGVLHAETVTNLEAVDDMGVSTWNGSFPIVLTGVLLTDPSEMLDSTPDYLGWDDGANAYNLGGQWQVFVQVITNNDRGGVECWMGQDYGNLPFEPHDGSDSYSDEEWSNEVYRVSHDPTTGYAFRKGDLVTINANGSLFYGGMQNINEEHSTDPAYDFTISLVATNYGLPSPQVISLSSVISTNLSATGHYDIFDPTRQTGGEFYQGMRVRINGLTLVTTNGWNTNSDWDSRYCTATDGEGRQFPLIHPLYDIGPPPTNQFDATGVFLQESGSGTDGTFGYELFVQQVAPSDAAILNIAFQSSSAVVSWPGSLSNYQLQSCDSLSNPNWAAITNTTAVVNGQNTIVLNAAGTQEFFRLQRVQ
ncbi:MAG TPA: hypothetical protein VMA13_01795 [Candidatus Saccharimonadales bacterium]|nr:hypothetical protein [Candidatus Saccharimonadales bacterium]